jgi:capsular exopolysaccharide synthesis family protein
MTLPEYLRLLRERWVLLVVAVALGLVGAGVVTVLSPQQYSANATLYIVAEGNEASGNSSAYEGSLLSKERMESYTQLLTSLRIARDVVTALRLDTSPEELAGRLSASAEPDTVLVTAEVVDASPDQAAAIANAVADSFVRLVAEIEKPADPARPPALGARIVEPAVAPTTPVSPKPSINFALGALVGLFVGVGAVVVRHLADTSFRSPRELGAAVGAPNLGSLAYDKRARRGRLVVKEAPQSQQAEAFRMLRTSLRSVANQGKVFVFTSALKGEGKSNVVCNLAVALGNAGCRVVVVDANLRKPRVSEYLGITSSYGLTEVITGTVDPRGALQPWSTERGGFYVLDSGSVRSNPSELLGSRRMERILGALRERYDYVLVDAPAVLLASDTAAFAQFTDGVVLVYRYGETRARDVRAATEVLQVAHAVVIGTVMTMMPRRVVRGLASAERPYRTPRMADVLGPAIDVERDVERGSVAPAEATAAAWAETNKSGEPRGERSPRTVDMPNGAPREERKATYSTVRPSPRPRSGSRRAEDANGSAAERPLRQE